MAYARARPGGLLLPRFLPWGDIEVDLQHPLASNLVSAYLPGSRRGTKDFGPAGVNLTPASANTVAPSAMGPGQRGNAVNQYSSVVSPTAHQIQPPLTIFWMGEATGTPDANCTFFGVDTTGGGSPFCGYEVAVQNPGSAGMQYNLNNAGSFLSMTGGTATPTSGVMSSAFVVTPSGRAGYLNGALDNSSAGISSISYAAGYTTIIGTFPTTSRVPNRITSTAYIWKRGLSQAEIQWLHSEPFAFFRQRVRRAYYVATLPVATGTLSVTAPVATLAGTGLVTVTGSATPTAPTATLSGTATVAFPVALGTLAVTAPVATLQGVAAVTGGVDTHDGDTWRKHRQGLRQLAKLAEERRRAKDEEAGDIRREILAALGEAKPLEGGAEVRDALDAVTAALPSRAPGRVTEAQLRRVTDWAPIYAAMEDLRRAIEYERMLEQDDEEVLLLL